MKSMIKVLVFFLFMNQVMPIFAEQEKRAEGLQKDVTKDEFITDTLKAIVQKLEKALEVKEAILREKEAIPGGNLAIPGENVAIRGGNVAIPGGDVAIPGGNVAVPRGKEAILGKKEPVPGETELEEGQKIQDEQPLESARKSDGRWEIKDSKFVKPVGQLKQEQEATDGRAFEPALKVQKNQSAKYEPRAEETQALQNTRRTKYEWLSEYVLPVIGARRLRQAQENITGVVGKVEGEEINDEGKRDANAVGQLEQEQKAHEKASEGLKEQKNQRIKYEPNAEETHALENARRRKYEWLSEYVLPLIGATGLRQAQENETGIVKEAPGKFEEEGVNDEGREEDDDGTEIEEDTIDSKKCKQQANSNFDHCVIWKHSVNDCEKEKEKSLGRCLQRHKKGRKTKMVDSNEFNDLWEKCNQQANINFDNCEQVQDRGSEIVRAEPRKFIIISLLATVALWSFNTKVCSDQRRAYLATCLPRKREKKKDETRAVKRTHNQKLPKKNKKIFFTKLSGQPTERPNVSIKKTGRQNTQEPNFRAVNHRIHESATKTPYTEKEPFEVTPVNKPMAPVNKPMSPVNKPMAPVNKPTVPVNKLNAPVNKQMAPVNKPMVPVNKQMAPVNVPKASLNIQEALVKQQMPAVNISMVPMNTPIAPINKHVTPHSEQVTQKMTIVFKSGRQDIQGKQRIHVPVTKTHTEGETFRITPVNLQMDTITKRVDPVNIPMIPVNKLMASVNKRITLYKQVTSVNKQVTPANKRIATINGGITHANKLHVPRQIIGKKAKAKIGKTTTVKIRGIEPSLRIPAQSPGDDIALMFLLNI